MATSGSQLRIDAPSAAHPDSLATEVVERKGRGHPDTLCDQVAEEMSLALGSFYQENFGRLFHYNVDKALLWAGATRPAFGGGQVVAPVTLFLAGRATMAHERINVPADEIAETVARHCLGETLHAFDARGQLDVETLLRPTSPELQRVFEREQQAGVWQAGDSSCGVGFAPSSELERVVLAVEQLLTSRGTIQTNPAIGEDVKVMGVRCGDRIDLTVATAIVDRYTPDIDAYVATIEEVEGLAVGAARRISTREVRVTVNGGDDVAAGDIYLTVSGTSAECGDDGQAGRGNRVGGLITPCRPMVMESVAGKNAATHVGKVYNVVAGRIAERLVAEIDEIDAATCMLVSCIGRPVAEPQLVQAQVATAPGVDRESLRPRVEHVAGEELARSATVWEELFEDPPRLY